MVVAEIVLVAVMPPSICSPCSPGRMVLTTTAVPGAETDSAEWIAESAYYEGFLALTQTTAVQFSGATATIGGVTHSISGWGSDVYWLLMVDYNFGVNQETGVATPSTETLAFAKADTSSLGRGGDNFSVSWLSGGP